MNYDIEVKTSQEWFDDIPNDYGFIILKYHGWDNRHIDFSYTEELITKAHFLMRVKYSICVTRTGISLAETQWGKQT